MTITQSDPAAEARGDALVGRLFDATSLRSRVRWTRSTKPLQTYGAWLTL